ncbi:hypothetical protein SVIOM342S_01736 [Streptomyces violaceorubidus]
MPVRHRDPSRGRRARPHGTARRPRPVLVHDGHSPSGAAEFGDDAQADAVTSELLARHPLIAGWIDLTDLDRPDPAAPGPWTARLLLIRRLVGARPGARLRGLQAVRGLQDLDGPAPCPSGARMAGFLRCLGAEYQRLDTTVLDTDLPTTDPERLAAALWGEWHRPGGRAEVCHRNGLRYEPVLRPTLARHTPLVPDPGRADVVTGGTRGIGARVAAHLVERGARAVAVLGGRPLPPRERWETPGALGAAEAEAVAGVRRLERLGARVLAHGGPLTDRAAVGPSWTGCGPNWDPWQAWCTAPAVRAAAGRPSSARTRPPSADLRAQDRRPGDARRPAEGDRLDFFVAFSSACALVPRLAVGVTDYAAANAAAADRGSAHRVRTGGADLGSVAWPMWTESGAARGKDNVCARSPFRPVTEAEAGRRSPRAGSRGSVPSVWAVPTSTSSPQPSTRPSVRRAYRCASRCPRPPTPDGGCGWTGRRTAAPPRAPCRRRPNAVRLPCRGRNPGRHPPVPPSSICTSSPAG